jgi:hypothetical protein
MLPRPDASEGQGTAAFGEAEREQQTGRGRGQHERVRQFDLSESTQAGRRPDRWYLSDFIGSVRFGSVTRRAGVDGRVQAWA